MTGSVGISGRHSGRLSASAYFSCVVLLTLAGTGLAMLARPALAHSVMQAVGLEAVPQAENRSFYAMRVAPLFETRCAACHGEKRQKSDLRLDSFAGLLRGGKHGAVIRPGDAKNSELFIRISLPAPDERAMPPNGKPVLTEDEKTVIRLWIAQGASGAQRNVAGAPPPVAEVKIPQDDPAATQKQRAALSQTVRKLQVEFPGAILYELRNSANLEVNAALLGTAFGDAQLRALLPLQARITRLDLSGTAVSDASAPLLAGMPSLRALRIGGSKMTHVTIAALGQSKALKSLTISGTQTDAGALAPLLQKHVVIYGGENAP